MEGEEREEMSHGGASFHKGLSGVTLGRGSAEDMGMALSLTGGYVEYVTREAPLLSARWWDGRNTGLGDGIVRA